MSALEDTAFEMANRAFVLMTLDERERVLRRFLRSPYITVKDRFAESVRHIAKDLGHKKVGATG